jgi:hypothetical protein
VEREKRKGKKRRRRKKKENERAELEVVYGMRFQIHNSIPLKNGFAFIYLTPRAVPREEGGCCLGGGKRQIGAYAERIGEKALSVRSTLPCPRTKVV